MCILDLLLVYRRFYTIYNMQSVDNLNMQGGIHDLNGNIQTNDKNISSEFMILHIYFRSITRYDKE